VMLLQACSMAEWFAQCARPPRPRPKRAPRHGGELVSHTFRRSGNEWRCSACGLTARTRTQWWSMRHRACNGPCALRAASSHTLFYLAPHRVTACFRCGAWATRKPRHLLRPCPQRPPTCPQRPPTIATAQALRRLQRGLHPTARLSKRENGARARALNALQAGAATWRQALGVRSEGAACQSTALGGQSRGPKKHVWAHGKRAASTPIGDVNARALRNVATTAGTRQGGGKRIAIKATEPVTKNWTSNGAESSVRFPPAIERSLGTGKSRAEMAHLEVFADGSTEWKGHVVNATTMQNVSERSLADGWRRMERAVAPPAVGVKTEEPTAQRASASRARGEATPRRATSHRIPSVAPDCNAVEAAAMSMGLASSANNGGQEAKGLPRRAGAAETTSDTTALAASSCEAECNESRGGARFAELLQRVRAREARERARG
jgi:hypothetical protein